MMTPSKLGVPLLVLSALSLICQGVGRNRERRQVSSRSCRTETGQLGSCITIRECPSLDQLLTLVKQRRAPAAALTRLRQETFKCDFVSGNPRVCCGDRLTGGGGGTVVRQETTTRRPTTRRPFRPQTTRRVFLPRTTTRRPFTQITSTSSPSISFGSPSGGSSGSSGGGFSGGSGGGFSGGSSGSSEGGFNGGSGGGFNGGSSGSSGGGFSSGARMPLPSEDECGMRTFDGRLFGGQGAVIGAWPWIASIGYRVRGRPDLVWGCGAVLITSRHALTAAHCIYGLSSNQIPEMVRLGELDFDRQPDCVRSDPGVCADLHLDVPIIGLVSHPGFQGRRNNAFADDLGLLTLGRSVASTDFIRPICLPLKLSQLSGGTDASEGKQAYIAGWGRSETTSFFTPLLQEARIQMRSASVCEVTYRRELTSGLGRRLCAGTGDGVDTCRGDSGGPLMVPSPSGSNWYLTGITSFGSNQCGFNPAVYTRVHDYVNWIRNNLVVDL